METTKKPTIVKDFNGNEINVKEMQQSLRLHFKTFCQKDIDDYGTPFLTNCVERTSECGCKIVGNGSLQFPLTIEHCMKHK